MTPTYAQSRQHKIKMLVNVIIIQIKSTTPSGTMNLTDTTTNLNELITYSIEGNKKNGQQTIKYKCI